MQSPAIHVTSQPLNLRLSRVESQEDFLDLVQEMYFRRQLGLHAAAPQGPTNQEKAVLLPYFLHSHGHSLRATAHLVDPHGDPYRDDASGKRYLDVYGQHVRWAVEALGSLYLSGRSRPNGENMIATQQASIVCDQLHELLSKVDLVCEQFRAHVMRLSRCGTGHDLGPVESALVDQHWQVLLQYHHPKGQLSHPYDWSKLEADDMWQRPESTVTQTRQTDNIWIRSAYEDVLAMRKVRLLHVYRAVLTGLPVCF